MNFKVLFVFQMLLICCYSTALNRAKRQLRDESAMSWALSDLGTKTAQAINNMDRCSSEAGCHKGYCWAWCGWSLTDGDWCYTTRGNTQSHDFVRCIHDYECDKCWKCGGPCTL